MKINGKDFHQITKVLSDFELDQRFKDLLLRVLEKLETKTINEEFLQASLNTLIEIHEEVDIYDVLNNSKIIESVIHLFIKEILSCKSTRQVFYQEINFELEKPLVGGGRPFLFIGLFECFMCNTNDNELDTVFNEEIENFYDFFYKVIFTVIDNYYESNTLLYFYDCEMWRVFGKSFSKYIKDKIQKCIEDNNIEEIYKIYPQFFNSLSIEDLLYVFNYQGLNLIPFLLSNITVDDLLKIDYLWGFDFEKQKDTQVTKCISEALLHILPKYEVEDWNDPLYLLGFFDYLRKDHINLLIEDPNVDFFELLMKNRCTESYDGNKDLKNFLKENKLSLVPFIKKFIREKRVERLYWFWDRWLWDVMEVDDVKELLEDKEIYFIEALLKSAYYHCEKEDIGFNYHFPEKIQLRLRPQLQEHLIQVLKNDEKESFIPLLAMRLLDVFEPTTLLSLIEDRELNLLNRINEALEHDYDKIMDLNESFYRWKINFIKFLSRFNIPISNKIDKIDPSEYLVFHLSPPDEEIERHGYIAESQKGSIEYVKIAGRNIDVHDGILDLSGLNIYNLDAIEGLFELKFVRILSLSNNFFTELTESFGNLILLEKVIIENCPLTILPESIGNLKNLRELNLHRNALKVVTKSIGNLESLESLDLSFNTLSELPSSFKKLRNLKVLNLRNNKLKYIPPWITSLKNLRSLNLMVNSNIRKIPDYIGDLESLEELILWNTGIDEFPKAIKNLKNLKRLEISNNYIREIPEFIGELVSLVELSCDPSTGVDEKVIIPDSILKCRSLRSLRLGWRTIEDPSPIIDELRKRGVDISR